MLKLYFVFLIAGFVGLLYSLIMGDTDNDLSDGVDGGDSIDDSPKVFSFRVIFSFLLAFGIGGGSVFYSNGSLPLQLLVGFGAGVATGALTWWLTSILYKMQGASNVDSDEFIGKTGDIVVGTTDGGKAKVRVNTTSGPMEFLCKEANDNLLKNGDVVRISGKLGTLLMVSKQ
jgi:membrane protein implicated in regulation of membrane protease activity